MLRWATSKLPGLFTGLHADGEILTVSSLQDVEPILEANKRAYNTPPVKGDFHMAARIPNVIAEKWMREEGLSIFNRDHWPAIAAKLDSPEYRYLRTQPGRLSRKPYRSFLCAGFTRPARRALAWWKSA